jgi:hypothetical protein
VYFWLAGPVVTAGVPRDVTAVAAAATIQLTAPRQPVTVPEGDDYFTQEMHHALQFDARRDLMWEEGFDEPTIRAQGGVWEGTFRAGAPFPGMTFPLFQGFVNALNLGRVGVNFPVDTTRYTLLSLRGYVAVPPGSQRNQKMLLWTRTGSWPDGSLLETRPDGVVTEVNTFVPHDSGAFVVDLYDYGGNPAWTAAPVLGVRFDPSLFGPPGTRVGLDWVRIVDPGSAPLLPIRWTTTGAGTGAGGGAGPTPQVNVLVDPGCQGGGNFLARVPHHAGRYDLPTAALPPGAYCFRLQLRQGDQADTLLATSGASAVLTIDARPTVRFVHPSPTTGPDYATEVVGNPWDMDGPADLDNLDNPYFQKSFVGEAFVDGAFTAIATPLPWTEFTDAQVWLHVDPGRPIPTARYRWLTIQMALDPTGYGDIHDKVEYGWGVRSIWWNTDIAVDGSETAIGVIYEGVNTVTLDLWDDSRLEAEDPYPAQTGWRGNPTLSHLRVDLAETFRGPGTRFWLYDVRLTRAPEPEPDGTFTLRLETGDLEGQTADLALYADGDRAGFDGTLLRTLAVSPGAHEVTIPTGAFPPGDTWLYAVVTDQWGRVTRRYADAPIHVLGPSCLGRAGADPGPVVTRGGASGKAAPSACATR